MIETTGKAIDALKSRPIVLAWLLFNAMVLGAVYFGVEFRHQELMLVLERCVNDGAKDR
jgi:hypothetical protein